MTSAMRIAKLVEKLPENSQEMVEEYIHLLQSKSFIIPTPDTERDIAYREYILEGIRQGEEDITNGKTYSDEEMSKLLDETAV